MDTNEKVLTNGAIELLRKPAGDQSDVVLALFRGEFVTWRHDKKDGLYRFGDYYGKELQEALNGFNERTG